MRFLLTLSIACLCAAPAAAQKAYKYVDEKGNVTYSQVPPSNKDAAKVDISPANSSRSPGVYVHPDQNRFQDRPDYQRAGRDRARQQDEAQKKRLADLEAQCNSSRGSDCKNPDTLKYIESQNIPRRRY